MSGQLLAVLLMPISIYIASVILCYKICNYVVAFHFKSCLASGKSALPIDVPCPSLAVREWH